MTCIVSFISDGRITMGGDSAGVNPSGHLELRQDPKVFTVGRYLIGVSGSWTASQRLRYSRDLPQCSLAATSAAAHRFMVTDVLPYLDRVMPLGEEYEVLLGFEGVVYHFYGSRQVAVSRDVFDACGSGAQVARGALLALIRHGCWTGAGVVVHEALTAAERFCSGVRGPFNIEEIK